MDPVRPPSPALPQLYWQDERDASGIPRRMLCPISQRLMLDPVIASDGYDYDAPMLRRLFAQDNLYGPVSPITRERLRPTYLANGNLQREVHALWEAYPGLEPILSPQQRDAVEQGARHGIARHQAQAAVVNSDLPEHASAEAYLASDLEPLMPSQALRHSHGPSEGTMRQRYLLESASGADLSAQSSVEGRRALQLPAQDALRSDAARRRYAFRPRPALGNPAQLSHLSRHVQSALQDPPLYRLLAAIYASDTARSQLLQPLLDDPEPAEGHGFEADN